MYRKSIAQLIREAKKRHPSVMHDPNAVGIETLPLAANVINLALIGKMGLEQGAIIVSFCKNEGIDSLLGIDEPKRLILLEMAHGELSIDDLISLLESE